MMIRKQRQVDPFNPICKLADGAERIRPASAPPRRKAEGEAADQKKAAVDSGRAGARRRAVSKPGRAKEGRNNGSSFCAPSARKSVFPGREGA